MTEQAERYTLTIKSFDIFQLLDELTRSVQNNNYGSHSDQIRIIRDEIGRRVS